MYISASYEMDINTTKMHKTVFHLAPNFNELVFLCLRCAFLRKAGGECAKNTK